MNTAKPLVLVTNRFDENLKLQLALNKNLQLIYQNDLFADSSLLSKAQGIIIRSSTVVDGDFFKKAPALKFIVTATSGFDHIDIEQAKQKDIRVFHVPQTQVIAAAELTVAMMFNCARKWSQANSQVRSGRWHRETLLGDQIEGQTLGLIGVGRVGRAVAKKAQALGMQVFGYDPYLVELPDDIQMLGFEELMRSCQVVSLHVPKTSETRHMIKKETLQWLNTDATLINMSRGDVINEADLVEHLVENPEFKVGLDVFAKEPLVTQSRLMDLSNVILSPHVGASTKQALRASSQQALSKMEALFRDEPVSDELPPQAAWYGI